MKMRLLFDYDKDYPGGVLWWKCPGCGGSHYVPANEHPWAKNGAKWKLIAGGLECPTLKPSVDVKSIDRKGVVHSRCHSVIKEGKIEYQADCTHSMAGLTVEMIDV